MSSVTDYPARPGPSGRLASLTDSVILVKWMCHIKEVRPGHCPCILTPEGWLLVYKCSHCHSESGMLSEKRAVRRFHHANAPTDLDARCPPWDLRPVADPHIVLTQRVAVLACFCRVTQIPFCLCFHWQHYSNFITNGISEVTIGFSGQVPWKRSPRRGFWCPWLSEALLLEEREWQGKGVGGGPGFFPNPGSHRELRSMNYTSAPVPCWAVGTVLFNSHVSQLLAVWCPHGWEVLTCCSTEANFLEKGPLAPEGN